MFRSRRSRKDFAEEIQAHLELEANELREEGVSEEEARRRARVAFGSVQNANERFYMRSRIAWLDNLLHDLRFAFRQLARNSIFATTAIVVLALGIGASVTIFSFVDAALIRPLPYADPSRLVSVFETVDSCPLCNVSFQNFIDWRRSAHLFRSLDVWGYARYALPASGGVESVEGTRVSDGFFRTLGVAPMLGRDFYPGEDKPGAPRTVLISYGAWEKRFGANPAVVGKTIRLDEISYAIIGVLPRSFHFAPRGETEFWTALNEPTGCDQRRGCHGLFGIGRLNDGVTVAAAANEIQSIAAQLGRQYPASNRGYGATALPLSESVVGQIRPVLLALLGGAILLLLIAYTNTGGLLLLRSEGRRQEIAVREALGASTSRLLQQFTTEGLLLTSSGTLLGLGSAYLGVRLLIKLIPAQRMEAMPFLLDIGFHPHVLAFAITIALLAVLMLTLAPALHLRSHNVRADIAEGARGSAGRAWRRLGSRLVIVELATSAILLVSAGLLGRSLYLLLNVSTGFRTDHLSSVVVAIPKSYKTDAQVMALERALLDRAQSLPGAVAVGITVSKPIRAWDLGTNIHVPASSQPDKRYDVPERDISASYLPMLGAKLLRGRYFTELEDDPAKPRIVLINERLASELFPGEDPIGKRIAYAPSGDAMQIIGVIEDIKEGPLDTPNRGVIYVPFNQNSWGSFELVVRSSQAPEEMLGMLLAAVHAVDSQIGTSEGVTMNQAIQNSSAAYLHRTAASLVGGFALLALVLTVVGLYGVVAYSVSQRTREIGVRMALGAQRNSICAQILVEAGRLVAIGLTAGLVCAIATSFLVRNLLFGVHIWDVMTFTCVVGVLGLASIVASFVPAYRAASINPVQALRAE